MREIERRIEGLGLQLPEAAPANADSDFVPVMIHQGVAYVSGQVPRINGEVPYPGTVGEDVTIEQAEEVAEYCVLKGLSCIKAATGSLNHVEQVLKIPFYMQAAPNNHSYSKVLTAASAVLVKIF